MRVGSTEEGGFTGKNNREVDGKVLDALCPRRPAASRNGALCKSFQVLGVPLRRIAAEKLNVKERTGPSHLVLGAATCAAQGSRARSLLPQAWRHDVLLWVRSMGWMLNIIASIIILYCVLSIV